MLCLRHQARKLAPNPLDLAFILLPIPVQDEGGAVGGAKMPKIPLLSLPHTRAEQPYGPDEQPGPLVLKPFRQVPHPFHDQ